MYNIITMKRHWKKILIIIVLFVAAAAVAYYLTRGEEVDLGPLTKPSQLTGVEVTPNLARRPILGVMIENTPAARPQTGLDSAGIVFEVVTEGGITRTLALYQEDMPEEVGPIRSLRPYFVDWVMGFDASVAHVGGSREALRLAEERGTKSLNQFRYSEPYYRTDDKPAPHNMYASTDDLRDLQKELDHQRSQFKTISRSNDNPSENPKVTEIAIDYSTPEYKAEFHYEPENNSYTRHLAGSPHIDAATNEPVSVKNLVVIMLPAGQDGVEAIGSGDALIFKDGKVKEAQWQKTSYEERLEINDSEGRQIPLNRGDSWFSILSEDRPVEY